MRKIGPIGLTIIAAIALVVVWQSRSLFTEITETNQRTAQVEQLVSQLLYEEPKSTPYDSKETKRIEFTEGHRSGWYKAMLTAIMTKDSFITDIYEPRKELTVYEEGEVAGWERSYHTTHKFNTEIPNEMKTMVRDFLFDKLRKTVDPKIIQEIENNS